MGTAVLFCSAVCVFYDVDNLKQDSPMEFSHSFGLVFPLLSYKSGNMRKFTENQAQGHDNDIQKKS